VYFEHSTAGVAHPAVFDSVIITGRATLRFYFPQDAFHRKMDDENCFKQVGCGRPGNTKFRKIQKQKAQADG
jgi:hypothetical protein